MEDDIVDALVNGVFNVFCDVDGGRTLGKIGQFVFEYAQTSVPATIFYITTGLVTAYGVYSNYKVYEEAIKNPDLQAKLKELSRLERISYKFRAMREYSKVRRKFFSKMVAGNLVKHIEENKKIKEEVLLDSAQPNINSDDAKVAGKEGETPVVKEETLNREDLRRFLESSGIGMTSEQVEALFNGVEKLKQSIENKDNKSGQTKDKKEVKEVVGDEAGEIELATMEA